MQETDWVWWTATVILVVACVALLLGEPIYRLYVRWRTKRAFKARDRRDKSLKA